MAIFNSKLLVYQRVNPKASLLEKHLQPFFVAKKSPISAGEIPRFSELHMVSLSQPMMLGAIAPSLIKDRVPSVVDHQSHEWDDHVQFLHLCKR